MQEELTKSLRLTDKNEVSYFGKPDEYDYSKFSQIDEFAWDMDLQNKFTPIAKKLDLSQESIDMLLEIALEMAQKQKTAYEKDDETRLNEDVLKYSKLLSEDNELPNINSLQMKQYMDIANGAYSDFASPKLKEILASTGLVYHPEVIKLFYKIGDLSQEDNLSHYGAPPVEELTPAQILYGTKN
ncbi:MAG: hypothetical protein IJW73_07380 [Candidatus Gastranaerophilales bacterium]|nr:hypothetical protein [Candidatus Gastranaerophilales bacterium]